MCLGAEVLAYVHRDMRPPVKVKQPSITKRVIKGGMDLYTIVQNFHSRY